MCRSDDFPPYDPPITEAQREALTVLHRVDVLESRGEWRRRNLMALGFDAAEAARLARISWRVQSGDDAA